MKKPLEALVAKKLRCSRSDISRLIIVRRSIDARRKPRIYFVFTVDVEFVMKAAFGSAVVTIRMSASWLSRRRRISGPVRSRLPTGPSSSGPARLAWRQPWPWPNTAMRLSSLNGGVTSIPARKTLKIFGAAAPSRHRRTSSSAKAEAGTFSDGKLTTRVNHPLLRRILQTFVDAGAPEDILRL